jgi:RNA polymerase sigma-70 factor (ECF subfamily)
VDDHDLLAAWRDGDPRAGEALFARHYRRMHRFFSTKCACEADELVQITFLAFVRARDRFRGESSFATYLFAIARRELYRALATRRRRRSQIELDTVPLEAAEPAPLADIANDEELVRLAAALLDLPSEQRVLLQLHYWDGAKIAVLAERFAVPEVTMRSRLHRARTALRARMTDAAVARDCVATSQARAVVPLRNHA